MSEPRRPDIQGLRAVAVLLVVGLHALGEPRGGFVGVDMFFVISGFVITSGLMREVSRSGRIALPGFYLRRARRILPASLLLLGVVGLLALLLPPTVRGKVSDDLLWALLGGENWRQMSIGALTSSDFNPVGHYWSLAVEEQFYLVWPLLILVGTAVGRRWNRPVGGAAVAVAAVLVASLLVSRTDTAGAVGLGYFSTASRGWELAAGGLLALLPVGAPDRTRRLGFGLVGAGAMAVAALLMPKAFVYPFPGALLPVFGTAALLVAAPRVLAIRPLRVVGDLSYSLYLWHLPVLAFVCGFLGVTPAAILSALALSVLLAWVSYRFVEQPFRDGRVAAAVGALLRRDRTPDAESPTSEAHRVAPSPV
ncbi:acyltransferase [Amnibacterium sp. CER49]|uniref:acyltransferase family protein n=1 Tax=Amnibacterium sp. CER49 TaxID=3039161 RepID=UPI00244BE3D7|nr:acyltransferase [Amnibacterium sp. CER49]MDH2444186.1 acyltransferase [Amnibacterium sp. CER49]